MRDRIEGTDVAGGGQISGDVPVTRAELAPSRWRALFPLADRCVFLDHAGVAPISTRVRAAIDRFADEAMLELPRRYPYWEERAEEVRGACARLVGVAPGQVAFVKNTSEGLSLVAEGLDLRAGDAVIVADREFPSNIYPWWGLRRLGVEVRMIEPGEGGVTPGDVERLLDGSVRVVALSAIAYGTGDRLDLAAVARLCRAAGALFVVDGIQAIGAVAVDAGADDVDCIVADGHKWLCAPEGCGFLAASERLLERLRPAQLGWKSVVGGRGFYPYDFSLRRDASRLEPGSLALLGVHALGAAVDLVHEAGADEIESRLGALCDAIAARGREGGRRVLGRRGLARAAQGASGAAPSTSGIVTLVPHGDPERVRQELWERGIVVKVRFGGLRIAPHYYQDGSDVDRLFAGLAAAEAAVA